ncbi:sodium bile acid symporter family-domain-containing protein [Hygrophoropsis aurantiaca]|uniref:Sodium bile acid symporter family-domain-containing protein n=1 Tax=Hygrophoropsis aurantiaca TaxID=72124 RepID=A0ACB8AU62_9AGAM|nr:sodium bile acid symporter family-domain-containing protein [Hygrophoropsis aurantiaca]
MVLSSTVDTTMDKNMSTELEESRLPSPSDQISPLASIPGDTLSPEYQEQLVMERPQVLFTKLSILDRLLTPCILLCMILGVVIGEFVPGVQQAFDTVQFKGVSVPIAIGLILMMWPILTKVRYESLSRTFLTKRVWVHIGMSMVLNWVVGPLVMLGVAWATLPDLPTYRTGVIMVGLARCIAMVMVWNQLAGGDTDYCAILVVVNSVLQIVLYSPYAVLFVDIIGGDRSGTVHLQYGTVAIAVLIYLGIPLVAGVVTRYIMIHSTSRKFFDDRFLPYFSPIALLGLLYTITVMFAYQGHHIIQNIGPVFRVFVPMVLYFVFMWSSAFGLVFWLGKREDRRGVISESRIFGYEMAVVQSFTAGSNNFELAIAVTIATYGVGSDQALAATIGPLVEVPVLLALTWVARYLHVRLRWDRGPGNIGREIGKKS